MGHKVGDVGKVAVKEPVATVPLRDLPWPPPVWSR
jgi:hypothetical protein